MNVREEHSGQGVLITVQVMDIGTRAADQVRLNEMVASHDDFFERFGTLDEVVYADDAISKLYKELTGLSISVLTRCEDCVLYHI